MPLIRRLPKRGFTNPCRLTYIPVNVGHLARFDDGAEVSVDMLRQVGLARGRADGVKILGVGEIDKSLSVKAHAFSAVARRKIEAAGGACEII